MQRADGRRESLVPPEQGEVLTGDITGRDSSIVPIIGSDPLSIFRKPECGVIVLCAVVKCEDSLETSE